MKIYKILFFLFLSNIAFSQVIEIPIDIQKFIGKWESTYEVTSGIKTGTIKEIVTIKDILNKQFIEIEITGGFVNDTNSQFKYSAYKFLTFNFEKEKFEGFSIDENGYNGMYKINGEVTEANTIIIRGESNLYSSEEVWGLKNDGKLYRKGKSKVKSSNKETSSEIIYNKIN